MSIEAKFYVESLYVGGGGGEGNGSSFKRLWPHNQHGHHAHIW